MIITPQYLNKVPIKVIWHVLVHKDRPNVTFMLNLGHKRVKFLKVPLC